MENEIKWVIEELTQIIVKLENEIDFSALVLQFDSHEFLMKNRGQIENQFIIQHRTNKEKLKTLLVELNQFYRQLKRILQMFTQMDENMALKTNDN